MKIQNELLFLYKIIYTTPTGNEDSVPELTYPAKQTNLESILSHKVQSIVLLNHIYISTKSIDLKVYNGRSMELNAV